MPLTGVWLDPCAGEGALVKATQQLHPDVHWKAIELREECREDLSYIPLCDVQIADFLSDACMATEVADVVLMNPPYRLAQEFIIKAMTRAKYVVVLLRLNFLGSETRAEWLRTWAPDVYVLPNRPRFRNSPGTDSIEYAWMVWDSGKPQSEGKIKVLPVTSKAERGIRVRQQAVGERDVEEQPDTAPSEPHRDPGISEPDGCVDGVAHPG